jgi:hypothetical protein
MVLWGAWSIPNPTSGGRQHCGTLSMDVHRVLLDAQSPTLPVSCAMTMAVSGNCTNKWTLIFPMVPLILLQLLRRVVSLPPLGAKTTNATNVEAKGDETTAAMSTVTETTTTMAAAATTVATTTKEEVGCDAFALWTARAITALSVSLILLAAALSLLFPVLQPPLPVPFKTGGRMITPDRRRAPPPRGGATPRWRG